MHRATIDVDAHGVTVRLEPGLTAAQRAAIDEAVRQAEADLSRRIIRELRRPPEDE